MLPIAAYNDVSSTGEFPDTESVGYFQRHGINPGVYLYKVLTHIVDHSFNGTSGCSLVMRRHKQMLGSICSAKLTQRMKEAWLPMPSYSRLLPEVGQESNLLQRSGNNIDCYSPDFMLEKI